MALKEINDDTIAGRVEKKEKRTDCWLSARIARIVNFQFNNKDFISGRWMLG